MQCQQGGEVIIEGGAAFGSFLVLAMPGGLISLIDPAGRPQMIIRPISSFGERSITAASHSLVTSPTPGGMHAAPQGGIARTPLGVQLQQCTGEGAPVGRRTRATGAPVTLVANHGDLGQGSRAAGSSPAGGTATCKCVATKPFTMRRTPQNFAHAWIIMNIDIHEYTRCKILRGARCCTARGGPVRVVYCVTVLPVCFVIIARQPDSRMLLQRFMLYFPGHGATLCAARTCAKQYLLHYQP